MKTILHLDSSEFFKKVLARLLSEKGFVHIGAKSVKEAKEILLSKKIDFIVSSLSLEEESGEEFIRWLTLGQFKVIPIFVLTGNENIDEKQAMFELGVVDYMTKSTSPDEIIEHIIKYAGREHEMENLRNLKIFVLDDSKIVIDFIKKIFETNGVENVTYCMEQGEIFDTEIFDCYIIDLVLKEKSGKHLIAEIRKRNKEAVIIAISSIDNNKTIINILQEGANDYIIKPFIPEIFIAKLKTNVRSYILFKELEKKNAMLALMVITDGLTGLYNHKYMFERLETELNEAKRYKKEISILMIDVDHFKRVNDTYGHPGGDNVLMELAFTLKNIFREIDIIGRYGGEEFMVILPETSNKSAIISAERARVQVEKIKWDFQDVKVTISIGAVTYNGEDTAEEIVEKADDLLYQAKHKGRNRVEYIL